MAAYHPAYIPATFNLTTQAALPNFTLPFLRHFTFSLMTILPLFDEPAVDTSVALDSSFTSQLQEIGREAVVTTAIAAALFSSRPYYSMTYTVDGANVSTVSLNVSIALNWADDGCDPSVSVTNVINTLAAITNLLGLVGPGCTVAAQPAAIIAAYNGLPDISYAATGDDLNNKVTYPTFYRTAPDVASELSAVVPILAQWTWQHLNVLVELDILQQGLLQDIQQQMDAAAVAYDVQSYQTGETDPVSIAPMLSNAAQTTFNAFFLYGSVTQDCIDILVQAANSSLLTPNYIWIIHPDCGIDGALDTVVRLNGSSTLTLAQLLRGQLLYVSAVANTQMPLLLALTQSYQYLVKQNTSLYNALPLPTSLTPSYTSLLAFDTVLTYLLAFNGLLQQAVFPSKAHGPSLTSLLKSIQFHGVTGLVNYSVDTGRRYGLGWSLQQIQPDESLLTLGYITLVGEKLSAVTDVTSGVTITQSYPVSVLAVDSAVQPQWAGGFQPVDYNINDDSNGTNVGVAVGIVVGSILGAALFLVLCIFCVGLVRRNVNRNAEILREAKEEAMRSKEEAELADALKSQFLSTMSHEIRTPMNGVAGFNHLLSCTELGPEQIEYVEGITVSTDHLLTVINDILDFSSIESGQMDLDISVVRLASIVEQAINIAYRPAFSSHLEVLTFIDPSLPEHIIGDQTRLRQILANLLSNSLKFSNAHSGQITILVGPTGQPPAIRPLVELPIAPPIEGMWMVGEGLWTEDALDEAKVGRVVADVAVMERGKVEKEDKARALRLKEEKKLKRRIRNILSRLKERKDALGGEAITTFPDAAAIDEKSDAATATVSSTAKGNSSRSPTRQGVSGPNGHGSPSPTPAEVEMVPPKLSAAPVDDYLITINTDSLAQAAGLPSNASTLYPPSSYERLSIACTIEDQGVGISADNQRKLFSRFSQVHVGYPGGTGLGLAISMFLSQLMGGTMWVVSKVGVGSRFGFSFTSVLDPTLITPRSVHTAGADRTPGIREESRSATDTSRGESAAAEAKPILPASPVITRSSAESPIPAEPPRAKELGTICFPRTPKPRLDLCILIVDDNLSLLRLTATTLTSWGCTVFCASSVNAAMTFVCTVYRLPIQPLRLEEGDGVLPADVELSRISSSPRASSALSVVIPAKLDVIMIDYHLQPHASVIKADKDAKAAKDIKDAKDKALGERKDGAADDTAVVVDRLNGMQLARAIHSRLTAQHRKRMLKTATEVFVSSSIPSPVSVSASPTQLRRRLVNPPKPSSSSSRTLINQPIMENASVERTPTVGGVGAMPPLARPLSLPDKITARSIVPLSSASPLLHNDRLSLSLQQNVPVLLLMVGLAEESSLAAHHSPQREACLTGKLRKPLSETQMLRALQMVRTRQKEVEDERAKEKEQGKREATSLRDLRATSAPAQHIRANGTAASPSSASSPSPTSAPAVITSPAARHLLAHRFPLKVLYAEDNLVNQRLLSRMLTKYGYTTDIAENGQVALDMLQKDAKEGRPPYDLVWMDMQMPVMGGVESSRLIRQLYGAQRPVIIGVTANAMESDKQKCLEVMDDYLSKPISFAVLEQALLKWGLKVQHRREKARKAAAAAAGAGAGGGTAGGVDASLHSGDMSDPVSHNSASHSQASTPHARDEPMRGVYSAPFFAVQEEEKGSDAHSASTMAEEPQALPPNSALTLSISGSSTRSNDSSQLWMSPPSAFTLGAVPTEEWQRFTSGGSIASTASASASPSTFERPTAAVDAGAPMVSPPSGGVELTAGNRPRTTSFENE